MPKKKKTINFTTRFFLIDVCHSETKSYKLKKKKKYIYTTLSIQKASYTSESEYMNQVTASSKPLNDDVA